MTNDDDNNKNTPENTGTAARPNPAGGVEAAPAVTPEPEPTPAPLASAREDISIDSALSAAARKGRPKDDKMTKYITYGAGGVFLLMIVLMVYSCQPTKGSMAYAICSTFLELNTPYPHTLNYTNYDISRTAVRIYFTNIDPFGEFKQEMIQCTYGPDEKMGLRLVEIERNRIKLDRSVVEEFNLVLPTIMANDPYRLLPPDWENPLLDKGLPMYRTHELPRYIQNMR